MGHGAALARSRMNHRIERDSRLAVPFFIVILRSEATKDL